LAGSWAAAAQAFEVEVDSETTAQGYQLRNAWGDPVLSRRRFLQTLGLHVVGIGENENAAASSGLDMSFHMRMRLDADFAIQPFESNYADYPSAFVPGLQRAPVDLVIGYFDIRNLAGGWLSARLGRQIIVDPLGWWSLDGALLRAELPVFLALEAYGGFEQRAGLPLSTGRFERDGVWRGDRTSLDANAYPEFLEAGLAPAHGFVLESIDLPVVHARVAYRRVWNTGKVATSPFSEDRGNAFDHRWNAHLPGASRCIRRRPCRRAGSLANRIDPRLPESANHILVRHARWIRYLMANDRHRRRPRDSHVRW